MFTFIPPSSAFVPNLLADEGDDIGGSPMKFWDNNIPRGDNIYLLTNFTVSATQPAYMTAWTDQSGVRWPGIKKIWRGGCRERITAEERTLLIAAGYGAYISADATFDTSQYDKGDQYA